MSSEKIIFGKKEEHRSWYIVSYSPPIESFRFASIDLVILDSVDKTKIAEAMESEARLWLTRYPIPVMVSAFNDTEDVIHLEPVRSCSHLMGFSSSEQLNPSLHWKLLKEVELPDNALDRNYLKKVYHDILYRTWTEADVERVKKEQIRMVRTAWLILFFWVGVIPLVFVVLGETSVRVAKMVLIYSIWKIFVSILKISGMWKKSKREQELELEEQEKAHHHYHCKQNPKGFLRLKIENFERETRERVRKEADALKKASAQS